ncbi:glycosyltransferase family A protein [Christiangramia sp. SM2212]|uniref:Glycosyltransferase family A protein n=1 Tax=Christiangramia sediminicola TaxID=3073267 RepID=A0ABU1EMV2_9FLAO|nr:glycosyltransferase family A protein [Christiangramia sp. SM2212]MDR5589715.1 glycosyltransferase family A protein [Christiangramia sp. SM2212]
MIKLIHNNAKSITRIFNGNKVIGLLTKGISETLFELAEKFPNEVIIWCEKEFEEHLNTDVFSEIFHHDLIMASYAIKSTYLPETIGYIDNLPFVNVNHKVLYPTWQMSTDVGGIKGKVLLHFRELFERAKNFGFLLNSIAKLGQQNGLFCYSAPKLVKKRKSSVDSKLMNTNSGDKFISSPVAFAQPKIRIEAKASSKELFSFTFSHYKNIRILLLFFCLIRYEGRFPLAALILSLFQKKYFNKNFDLSDIDLYSRKNGNRRPTVDVIIPTLGRKEYLLKVLEDLKAQSLKPRKVIIVEQNPDPVSTSDLPELNSNTWPFYIFHFFINETGACNSRNIALNEVNADWVFFADDDIRFDTDLLSNSLDELKRLGADCLNINCKQKGENSVFHKIKQWGSFGSGTSIVSSEFAKNINFDEVFEYGFGEDKDYGMKLRNAGCDIIYHPSIEILHLKAPRGGFRESNLLPWEKDKPKPSPTIMVYAIKHYTLEQLRGFKTELFLRYYFRQKIKNPVVYYKGMKKKWKNSEFWADKLNSDEVKFLNSEKEL